MDEIWKEVPGFSGYLVSNKGRVASIICAQPNVKTGYHTVAMTIGAAKGRKGKGRLPKKRVLVHRAVLEAFVGSGEGLIGRHLNDDRANNALDNLAWGSKRDNAEDARANGRLAVGERVGGAKLSEAQAVEVRRRYIAGEQPRAIAADFGIHETHAVAIGKGRFWRHLPGPIIATAYLKGKE